MVENEDSKISGTQTRIKNDANENRKLKDATLIFNKKQKTDKE